MTDWALVAILGSMFFWGLARGTTICLSICVPGLLPYLAEKPRGPLGGAKFGLLLCLPRMAIFTVVGFIWGAVSYAIFASSAFEDAAIWIYAIGYTVLGFIIVFVGLGMFLKAAKEKDELRKARLAAEEVVVVEGVGTEGKARSINTNGEAAPPESPMAAMEECAGPQADRKHRASRSITGWLLRFVPESKKGERTFVLLWGSILGLTCLLEVSILEVAILGGAAANLAEGTLNAALAGGVAMFLFALGASIPVISSSAAFAAYIDRVETKDKLLSLRVTGSLVMILIGGMLFIRYLFLVIVLIQEGGV